MAFPISSPLGAYQITNLTFTPSTIVPGEKTTMSVTVKNTSGKKITKMYVNTTLYLPATNSSGYVASSSTYLYGTGDFSKDNGMSAVSWASGSSMTFTKEICPSFSAASLAALTSDYHYGAVTMSGRTWGLLFGIVPAEMVAGSTNTDNFYNVNMQGESGELLHIISSRDNPRLSFNADRCTNGVLNDEGVNLLTDIKLDSDKPNSQILEHGYSASLSCSPEASGSALNATISQMVSGITDSPTAIAGTYSNGSDYLLTLTVTNGYETAVSKFSIARAFANVHMSGCSTGGVAFGRFSSSTDGSPKFECEYPAYFYGGIACGINMQSGFVAAANISSGSLRTITVKFDTAFTTAPVVMLTLSSGSTAGSNGRVGCGIVPGSITTSGFQCKIWNGDSSARSPGLYWLAVST